jgi:hypothetical protein
MFILVHRHAIHNDVLVVNNKPHAEVHYDVHTVKSPNDAFLRA